MKRGLENKTREESNKNTIRKIGVDGNKVRKKVVKGKHTLDDSGNGRIADVRKAHPTATSVNNHKKISNNNDEGNNLEGLDGS